MIIRTATKSDIPKMVAISKIKRKAYEKIQPLFWKYAKGAEKAQAEFFSSEIKNVNVIALVSEEAKQINGFIIGNISEPPPVYDPGLTCVVDDFAVLDTSLWQTAGKNLLCELKLIASSKGATQFLIVCGWHDIEKTEVLKNENLSIVTNLWAGPIGHIEEIK